MFFRFLSVFAFSILLGCGSEKDNTYTSEYKLVLKDSLNLAQKGLHLISVFDQAKVDNEESYIVDLLGGQIYGFRNGREIIFELERDEIGKIDYVYQPGNIARYNKQSFIFLPASRRIIHLDSNKSLVNTILLAGSNEFTSDNGSTLFEYNPIDSSFFITLAREASVIERYKNCPLVGKFNYEGELINRMGKYPSHYDKVQSVKDLNAWKYSFFDFDGLHYYAVFNKYNYIHQYDTNFKLLKKIKLNDNFMEEEFSSSSAIGSFKKHPKKDIFYIEDNEHFINASGQASVRVWLKWFDLETEQTGRYKMSNFFRIFQITNEGIIVTLDRDSHEDAYFYFYRME